MIKGKVIKERDGIDRPEVNYRKLDGLNCSMIKMFDTDPILFFNIWKLGKKKKELKTTSLIIGDLVDFYLLSCQGDEDEFEKRFDEKFALMEGTKGTGQVFVLADIMFEFTQRDTDENGVLKNTFDTRFSEAFQKIQSLGRYKGATEDKALKDFSDNGFTYFQTQLDNIGKIVIELSLLDKAKRVADILMDDEFTKDVFRESDEEEYFPKHAIEWIYTTLNGKEIKCKSEIDILKVDHKKKEIRITDLKTGFDNEEFTYSYFKYRYDLQAAFYFLAVKHWAVENGMREYIIFPMTFVVGDTSSNNRRPLKYPTEIVDLQSSLKGFNRNGSKYNGLEQIIEEISWSEDNNIWNISKRNYENNGICKLESKYE